MKTFDTLDTTAGNVTLGNHSIWLPSWGIKVPFQWSGHLTKRSRHEGLWPREASVAEEVVIMRALAAAGLAPPIGGLVFYRNVISTYPGAWHCDPCGAFGYEVADANALPKRTFDIEAMRRLPIAGSAGAWGDVTKPDNIVNGYLVDVRRSAQDLLRWTGDPELVTQVLTEMRLVEATFELVAQVHRDCQFPPGERELAYQDFWFAKELHNGQRRVVERAQALGFAPKFGESILDIGTQSGSFLQYACTVAGNAGKKIGVDSNMTYIARARDLARSCGQNICFRQMDVAREQDAFLAWTRDYFNGAPDHLLLLSMEKHLGDAAMFRLIDAIGARTTYIETNAVATDNGEGAAPTAPFKLLDYVIARGGAHVGDSRDRNLRRLYRIERGR